MTDWITTKQPVPYAQALSEMETMVEQIIAHQRNETIWLLSHPHVYSFGTSAKRDDLQPIGGVETITTGRGGQGTYHGPGQRIAYVMMDLRNRCNDIRKYIDAMQSWAISSLQDCGIHAYPHDEHVGLWVDTPEAIHAKAKIAAIGIRLRKWVSFHGIAFNLDPDLEYFRAITPCGINDQSLGVTSASAIGKPVASDRFDEILRANFAKTLGVLGK